MPCLTQLCPTTKGPIGAFGSEAGEQGVADTEAKGGQLSPPFTHVTVGQ